MLSSESILSVFPESRLPCLLCFFEDSTDVFLHVRFFGLCHCSTCELTLEACCRIAAEDAAFQWYLTAGSVEVCAMLNWSACHQAGLREMSTDVEPSRDQTGMDDWLCVAEFYPICVCVCVCVIFPSAQQTWPC